MASKQPVKKVSAGDTEKPFNIAGSLSARLDAKEIETLLELQKKLSTPEKPIKNHRELINAMVNALQTAEVNAGTDHSARIVELETELQKYSSIDITQLQVDNLSLQTQLADANTELTKVKEEYEQFKLNVDTTNDKFNNEHYCIAVNDARLQRFFAGSNARIAAKKANVTGRIVTCHEDTIEDLAAFAARYAHSSELFNS